MYILAREPHSVTTVLDKIDELDEKEKLKIMSALRRPQTQLSREKKRERKKKDAKRVA